MISVSAEHLGSGRGTPDSNIPRYLYPALLNQQSYIHTQFISINKTILIFINEATVFRVRYLLPQHIFYSAGTVVPPLAYVRLHLSKTIW